MIQVSGLSDVRNSLMMLKSVFYLRTDNIDLHIFCEELEQIILKTAIETWRLHGGITSITICEQNLNIIIQQNPNKSVLFVLYSYSIILLNKRFEQQ